MILGSDEEAAVARIGEVVVEVDMFKYWGDKGGGKCLEEDDWVTE